MYPYPLKCTVILFIFIAFLTITTAVLVDRYREYGENLLEINPSQNIALNWEVDKSDVANLVFSEEIILSNPDIQQHITLVQKLRIPFMQGDMFRLAGELSTKNILPGAKAYNQARLLMVQYDHQKRPMWEINHVVAALSRTHKWKKFTSIFKVSPQTKDIRTVIQLIHCSGQYKIKHLELKIVKPNPWYNYLQMLVFSSWGIFFFFLFKPLLHNNQTILLKATLLAIAIGIIVAATLPKDVNSTAKTIVFQSLKNILNPTIRILDEPVQKNQFLFAQKIGHFFFFGIFALLLLPFFHAYPFYNFVLIFILFAGAIECLQFFALDRTPSLFDFLIDCAGALIGYMIYKQFFLKKQ